MGYHYKTTALKKKIPVMVIKNRKTRINEKHSTLIRLKNIKNIVNWY